MGCDIHAHLEILTKQGWEHYSKPMIHRNYDLFSKMAGVRGDEIPISLPKGLPNDLSFITQVEVDHWGETGHTHSWLDKDELREVIDFHNNQFDNNNWKAEHLEWGYICGNGIGYLNTDGEGDYPDEYLDVRLVFWFDN